VADRFTVNECGVASVAIDGGGEHRAVVREQLQVYLQLWLATHSGVSVVVDADEAETGEVMRQEPWGGAVDGE
jgi:hypothetical protein